MSALSTTTLNSCTSPSYLDVFVHEALGDLPHGSLCYQTISAAGLTLLLFTLACNIAGHLLRRRYREAYWDGERAAGTVRAHRAAQALGRGLRLGLFALTLAALSFAALFVDMLFQGAPRLSWEFFSRFPSRRAAEAGILSAWVGTFLVMLVTAAVAVPLGVAAGVWLEEYAGRNWLTDVIEINITNLAGVPSIVYGLLIYD